MQKGFDTKKYVELQSKEILKRLTGSISRSYFEIGGKLGADMHASRVLPGYEPDAKLQVLAKISKKMELVYCISAIDLERQKHYPDTGLTYNKQLFKDLELLEKRGLDIRCVAITIYNKEKKADELMIELKKRGIDYYVFNRIENYPNDLKLILSDKGFGKEPEIEFDEHLIGITGPGGGSGKFGICMTQLYHDYKKGNYTRYAKNETFPVWDLPIDHAVNLSYEAATADLGDENMIDLYYKKKYGKDSVNYNRDIENFAIMKELLSKLAPKAVKWCSSPTEMGINMVAKAITSDALVSSAAEQEIIRRYKEYQKEHKEGMASPETVARAKQIMEKAGLSS
jgi:uncharacterized protein (UPF0371 family)